MKKLFFITMVFACASVFAQPVETVRVTNATTEFGETISVGTQVYDIANNRLYVATEGVASDQTLTTASDSFTLLADYDRLSDIYASLFQAVTWDSDNNTYNRQGSVSDIAVSQSAGDANLPIQSEMKRCMLLDNGTVNYYIDADNPIMIDGQTVYTSEGTTTSTSSDHLVDSGADFVTDGVDAGMVVHNTTDDTYAIIKVVNSATDLTVAPDIMASGEAYDIGTANYGGDDGQVMVEIPKFYYKQEQVDDLRFYGISRYQIPGYVLHPAFWKDGQEVNYRYYSAFEGSMYDSSAVGMVASGDIATDWYAAGDEFCSVAGQWAKTNETRAEYLEGAVHKGSGWRNLDWALNSAVQLLYLIEYADFDSQSMIGNGRTDLSGGSWTADSYIGMTGLSVGDGNTTANVSNGGSNYLTDYMTYRGIENWYGNVWKMLSGLTWDGTWTGVEAAQPVYYTNNIDYFQDQGSENMRYLTDASYIGASANYIIDFENTTFGFIPSEASSSSSYIGDYYYQYSEIERGYWRLPLFGGVADFGSKAGGFALLVPDVWSADGVAIGSRLCY